MAAALFSSRLSLLALCLTLGVIGIIGDQRYRNLSQALKHAQEKIADLDHALEYSRKRADTLNKKLKQSQQADVSGTGEAHRAAMEAMMRRVENEREYMKSQLDTELECKEQLQTALDKVNVQFAEAQARWKDQAEDAETARRNGAQEQLHDLLLQFLPE